MRHFIVIFRFYRVGGLNAVADIVDFFTGQTISRFGFCFALSVALLSESGFRDLDS